MNNANLIYTGNGGLSKVYFQWKNLKDTKNDANKGLIGMLLMTRLGLMFYIYQQLQYPEQ